MNGLRVSPWIAVRMGFVLAVWCVFEIIPWGPLPRLQRDLTGSALHALGYRAVPIESEGVPTIVADRRHYTFTPECTYVDLLLMVLPFVWDVRPGVARGCLRVLVVSTVVLAGNFVRVTIALALHIDGGSWFLCHDLPDTIVFYPAVCAALIWRLRRDHQTLSDDSVETPLPESVPC